MPKISSLDPQKLHATLDPERVQWESSTDIPRNGHRNGQKNILQPRALEALNLALHITTTGYNIYLSGEADLGRTYMLQEFLSPRARKEPTPPDLLYVNNFADPDKPRLIAVPAGQGHKLKKALSDVLAKVRKELPTRLEADGYVKQRGKILDKFQSVRTKLIKQMDDAAGEKDFNLDMDDNGALTLYPMVEGKRLSEEEFDRLDATLRQKLKRKGDALLRDMAGLMRQLSRAEQEFKTEERSLERATVEKILDELLTPLVDRTLRAHAVDALKEHFTALRADILDNVESFLPRDSQPNSPSGPGDSHFPPLAPPEGDTFRYDINLFVDNSATSGAPIVVDDHPTTANLLGCVEREAELGALVTDFTLIKAGSLHKANGGYLVLHMEDILQHPNAWEGLLRALRSSMARIEEAGEGQDSTKTKGIEPEPLPLQIKVVLIGGEAMYESLLVSDDRFPKLFKLKAHMSESTERNAASIKAYLIRVARIIDEANLLPFDRAALAWLVDFGSRLIEDQRKLSLKFPLIRDMMIEASAHASMDDSPMVTGATLEKALDARTYRANLVEDIFMEEYDRELIKVRTSGTAVGRVNGLSVTWHGDFEFGLPHQISCTVGVGHEGIIDLEREAELGGPIHTKAMMILKSYLVDQFAHTKPIILSGSLCFEQSYAGIEGDSASGAELVALLSAIARVPVRLDLAFTGAVSQSGQIMAVGGVSHKIEGFFKVCARHGLTGSQGVIIPHDNAVHLMLPPRIIEAVAQGKFAVYPVQHIEEALELLTGLSAGRRRKDNSFTADSLYDAVDRRLQELGHCAVHAYKKPGKKVKI
ncbi:MAG: ATP-binding protein [Desulfovibrionaceae bacterium]